MKKIIFLFLIIVLSCKKEPIPTQGNIKYWAHVYDDSRLTLLDNDVTVLGIIKDSKVSEDGDQIYYLSTPNQYLLNSGNILITRGYLILEVICINPVSKDYVGVKCIDYINTVWLPNIGDTVKVKGVWVYDKHHGWNEIHPVVKIVKL